MFKVVYFPVSFQQLHTWVFSVFHKEQYLSQSMFFTEKNMFGDAIGKNIKCHNKIP